MHEPKIQSRVLQIVAGLARQPKPQISNNTSILIELDFDSLQLLELIEEVRTEYNIDLSKDPNLIQILETPRSLANAILQLKTQKSDG
jgi:acyl carrier protein